MVYIDTQHVVFVLQFLLVYRFSENVELTLDLFFFLNKSRYKTAVTLAASAF